MEKRGFRNSHFHSMGGGIGRDRSMLVWWGGESGCCPRTEVEKR